MAICGMSLESPQPQILRTKNTMLSWVRRGLFIPSTPFPPKKTRTKRAATNWSPSNRRRITLRHRHFFRRQSAQNYAVELSPSGHKCCYYLIVVLQYGGDKRTSETTLDSQLLNESPILAVKTLRSNSIPHRPPVSMPTTNTSREIFFRDSAYQQRVHARDEAFHTRLL